MERVKAAGCTAEADALLEQHARVTVAQGAILRLVRHVVAKPVGIDVAELFEQLAALVDVEQAEVQQLRAVMELKP